MADWPATLSHGQVQLRPLRRRDQQRWLELRRKNYHWLKPWEATLPPAKPGTRAFEQEPPQTFKGMLRSMRADAQLGKMFPFAITYDDVLVGQLTVSGIVHGSVSGCHMGYWVDQEHAGRGIGTTAVALAVDHCIFTAGIHRVEICIRPENERSLRIVQKLQIRPEGRRKSYLHINGAWRDHLVFAVVAEEIPNGLVSKLCDLRHAQDNKWG